METTVPPSARDLLTQLKDALTCTADAVLAVAGPSVDPLELQDKMAGILNANPPVPGGSHACLGDAHRSVEADGPYADTLKVRVTRPANFSGLLEFEFSVGVVCSDDHMLLVYELRHGVWRWERRGQAPL